MADLLRRLGLRRTTVSAWQQAEQAVPLEDVEAVAELAREAASPFGYRRPAQELLARFGGDTPDARRRATAALALAGVVADPPLASVQPFQWVQLRRAEVDPTALAPEPAAASPAPAPEPAAPPPPAPDPPELMPRRPSWAMRVAARHAPSGPVGREGRVRAGALGLLALVALIVAVVALRGAIGSPADRGTTTLPLATEAAQVETPATTTTTTTPPPAARPRTRTVPGVVATPPARSRSAARRRAVRLRIVPSEPSYVCIADGVGGRTVWEGMLTAPYEARGRRLVLRVGVATARVTVNGRALRIASAPSTYLLTRRGVSGLPADRPVCGG